MISNKISCIKTCPKRKVFAYIWNITEENMLQVLMYYEIVVHDKNDHHKSYSLKWYSNNKSITFQEANTFLNQNFTKPTTM